LLVISRNLVICVEPTALAIAPICDLPRRAGHVTRDAPRPRPHHRDGPKRGHKAKKDKDFNPGSLPVQPIPRTDHPARLEPPNPTPTMNAALLRLPRIKGGLIEIPWTAVAYRTRRALGNLVEGRLFIACTDHDSPANMATTVYTGQFYSGGRPGTAGPTALHMRPPEADNTYLKSASST
jgi:hypothetical protein